MLGLVPGGKSVKEAVTKASRALRQDVDEGVLGRATANDAPLMADGLARLMSEVLGFAEQPIVVVLDDAQRLDEADRRLLADIAPRVPKEARLWLGYATATREQRDDCEWILSHAPQAAVVEVGPLSIEAVARWCADAGIAEDAEDVQQWSGGYPLLVGDVIAELGRGARIEELPVREQFVVITAANLRRLSSRAAVTARTLAVLPTRLPDRALRAISNLDAPTWGHVVDELTISRVFTQTVAGGAWFHEQRRRYIEQLIDDDEAADSRARVVPVVRDLFEQELHNFQLPMCEARVRLLDALTASQLLSCADTSMLRGRLQRARGDYEGARRYLNEAHARAPGWEDWREREAIIAHNLAEVLRLSGEYDRAVQLWDDIGRYGQASGDLEAQARAAWGKSLTLKMIGAGREALALSDEVKHLRRQIAWGRGRRGAGWSADSKSKQGHLNRHRVEVLCYLGDYRRAAQECAEGFEHYADEHGSPAWWELVVDEAQLVRLEGDFRRASDRTVEAQHGFADSVRGVWKRGSVTVLRQLGQIATTTGDDDHARALWVELLQSDPSVYPHAHIYAQLGFAELARSAGELEDADRLYRHTAGLTADLYRGRSPALHRRYGSGGEHTYALLGMAETARARGAIDVATEFASQAVRYARARDVPWLKFWSLWVAARCADGLARDRMLSEAETTLSRFRRRSSDINIELRALDAWREGGAVGDPGPRFNFP